MLRQAFLLMLIFSVAFPTTGAECPASNERCLQEACTRAGGDLGDGGYCAKGASFDETEYSKSTEVCAEMDRFCVQNDGFIHNMSCLGPIFILLALAAFLRADGTP